MADTEYELRVEKAKKFFSSGLYLPIPLDQGNWHDSIHVEFFSGTIETHCVECGKEGPFRHVPRLSAKLPSEVFSGKSDRQVTPQEVIAEETLRFPPAFLPSKETFMGEMAVRAYALMPRVRFIEFHCQRQTHAIPLVFAMLVANNSMMKIGQYPSLADLQKSEVAQYRKVLDEEKLKEFTKAIGLHAHGIGIGAFVYLRRIFETLIEQAHQRAKSEPGWDETAYPLRMEDRIQSLSHQLPEFLVKNRKLYGILSIGIHDLSEEDCLGYFDPVRNAIELILDEELARREKQNKMQAATKALEKITTEVQSRDAKTKKPETR